MELWRCCLACIILYFIYFDWWNPYPSVPLYHQSPLNFYLTFFHSLSILSLFSASFLLVFIQLLSYSFSTLMYFWLPYFISQCNFQSPHHFYLYSPSLLPLSVSSRHVSLPSTLPLHQFLRQEYVVLLTSTDLISLSLSFYLTPSLCPYLSLSVCLFFLLFRQFFLSESSIVSC